MKYNENNVGFLTGAMRFFALAATCLLAPGAWAAQFKPTTGGDLDNSANWSSATDASYAVVAQQSAPLTLSSSSATLPSNGNLVYRTNVHTNDFGADNTLTVPMLVVELNATLVHKSGKIMGTSASASVSQQTRIASGNAEFSGADSALEITGGLNVGTDTAGSLAANSGASVSASGINIFSGSIISAQGGGTKVNCAALALNGGAASIADGAELTVTKSMVVTNSEARTYLSNSAQFNCYGNATIKDGGALGLNGATMHFASQESQIKTITVESGGLFAMTNSTLNLEYNTTNNKYVQLCPQLGSDVRINGCNININNNGVVLGGTGTLLFEGGTSEINHRFSMTGNGFCFAVSNTTVNFNPTNPGDLFITGAGNSNESTETGSERVLRFSGASPHLIVGGTGGLFLRGKKITLQFDLPKGEFTTLPIIEIPNASASFRGDEYTLGISQIVVNIDNHTAPGTYILLKGKNASTFLTGENKWVTNSDRAVISAATVGGVDAVQVTVKSTGLAIFVR